MKRLIILLCSLYFFVGGAFAQIEGEYEIIEGKILPQAHSLETVRLIELFVFTCPHCKNFHPEMMKLEKKFGKKIQVNKFSLDRVGDEPSKLYYIGKQDKRGNEVKSHIFNAAHNLGLGNQIHKPKILKTLAQQLNLYKAYQTLKESPEILREVEAGKNHFLQSGAKNVPTVIVEGVFRSRGAPENLIKIINSLLKKPVENGNF